MSEVLAAVYMIVWLSLHSVVCEWKCKIIPVESSRTYSTPRCSILQERAFSVSFGLMLVIHWVLLSDDTILTVQVHSVLGHNLFSPLGKLMVSSGFFSVV